RGISRHSTVPGVRCRRWSGEEGPAGSSSCQMRTDVYYDRTFTEGLGPVDGHGPGRRGGSGAGGGPGGGRPTAGGGGGGGGPAAGPWPRRPVARSRRPW